MIMIMVLRECAFDVGRKVQQAHPCVAHVLVDSAMEGRHKEERGGGENGDEIYVDDEEDDGAVEVFGVSGGGGGSNCVGQ